MVRARMLMVGSLFLALLLVGCLDNPTGRVTGGCPQYQCVKSTVEAQYKVEPVILSGKGPTLFPGTVHPQIKLVNPNDEPAKFKVTFLCENLYKSTSQIVKTGEVWIQPGSPALVQGDFKVGVKENWECSYEVSASSISDCQLQQI